MAAVLEVPLQEYPIHAETDYDVIPAPRRFTVDEYYRLQEIGILSEDDHIELIEGEILIMAPKGIKHSASSTRANRWFIRKLGNRAIVRNEQPIHLDDDSEPEPDLVVAAPVEDEYDYHHPIPAEVLLVIEVANSSLAFDRAEKNRLYARAGIIQYCILNLRDRTIEDYRHPGRRGYRSKEIYTEKQRFNLVAFPDIKVRVAELLPRQPNNLKSFQGSRKSG